MPLTIIQRGDPQEVQSLQRDFKPLDVYEGDMTGLACQAAGFRTSHTGSYRVMVVEAVSRLDANQTRQIGLVIGAATGAPILHIPCGNHVEWAQIQEVLEARQEKLQRREAARIQRLAARQSALTGQLVDIADNMTKQKLGLSTFGATGKLQRSSQQ